MRIKINTYCDPQLSQNFPNDPFGDLTITTSYERLHLQKAFLAMQSTYFNDLNKHINQIDLSFLHEQPLLKILRSLYGDQLSVQSAGELVQLFPIIIYLGIQQYRSKIQTEIKTRKDLMQSLDILQLSFRYNLCKQILIQYHVRSKLSVLQNSKNYLQIGKISHQCFNQLTKVFLERYEDQLEENSKILNNVMENYFNRKNIKALQYLTENKLKKLLNIWMNYHHITTYQVSSQPVIKVQGQVKQQVKNKEEGMKIDNIAYKKNILKQLTIANLQKDNEINELLMQIKHLRQKIGISSQIVTTKSIFLSSNGQLSKIDQAPRLMFGLQVKKKSMPYRSMMFSASAKSLFKRDGSGEKIRLVFNRMGSKNIKKWL